MNAESEVGKHAMCTYHVRGRNEKIVGSTYLTSDTYVEELENKACFYLFESSF